MASRATLPEAYTTAYAAALRAWTEELCLEDACAHFQRAAAAVAGLEGARLVRLDALFYASKMLAIQSTLSLSSDVAQQAMTAAAASDAVLDLLADRSLFEFRANGPRCEPVAGHENQLAASALADLAAAGAMQARPPQAWC